LNGVIEECLFKEYLIGIENKNLRLIVRSVEEVEGETLLKAAQDNLLNIAKILHP
jgi:hypothetical protein